jgi:uncharacterized protein DUF4412
MKRFFTAAALCLFVASTYAANGVVISMKTTGGGGGTTSTDQIQLDANHMRTQMTGRGGGENGVVFDGTKQTLYIIDDTKKTYSEITKDDLDRMAAQLAQVQQQMQGAMANMSPEQRAQIEAMMRGRGGRGMPGMPAPAAKPTYKKTGTDKVGKWTCDKYEGYQGDRKTSEVCTVAPTALGLSESDFAVTKEFAKFFSGVMPNMSDRVFSLGSLEDRGFVGVPIRTISYGADGSVTNTSELTDITHQNIPDSTFAPPTGYAKQDMGFGRGRRGGE